MITCHQLIKNTRGRLLIAALLFRPFATIADEEITKSSAASIGTNPGQAKVAGASSSDGSPPLTIRTSTQDWEFGFHGYLRAPLRLSFDTHEKSTYPLDEDGIPITSGTTPDVTDEWHVNASPAIVDGTYTDWKFTNSLHFPLGATMSTKKTSTNGWPT